MIAYKDFCRFYYARFMIFVVWFIVFIKPVTAQKAIPLGEGLYRPSEISIPDSVKEALPGVIRIIPKIRFRLMLYASADSAKAVRSRPEVRKKEFLVGGGVVWPVVLDTTALYSLCDNPIASAQPGFYEICNAMSRSECESFPCIVITEHLGGSATGFVIGTLSNGDFVIATNYHVAREAIERHKRTQGVYDLIPVPAEDLVVKISQDGTHARDSYRVVKGAKLLANASEQDWKQGKDWALLSIPAEEMPSSLKLLNIGASPPQLGDNLYAVGFPTRTRRDIPQTLNYENADDDLRISVGIVVKGDSLEQARSHDSDILATMDAVAGSSGSPVINQRGEVIGIIRNHTHTQGELDLRIGSYGGLTQIVPIRFVKEILYR